ncbi:MAG: pyridoxamine 5'-phosphate oxidase [Terrimicrobiaceae bacterium]|nr:pyridoxamine 5'-phosphate oxidase [Terrimicrobiaceae bacterium]
MQTLETRSSFNPHKEIRHEPLDGPAMDPSPFVVFGEWFDGACAAGVPEANAMSLATAGADRRVTCRTVLLKAWDERGFVFFTNYTSEKAAQLTENPRAAVLFPWLAISRQIEITGCVEKITSSESLAYFLKRPFKSRVGAWVSAQSSAITSRALLEAKFHQMLRKFSDGQVPLPDSWGGYRLAPEAIEFWQYGEHELHDRILYKRAYSGAWRRTRLQP